MARPPQAGHAKPAAQHAGEGDVEEEEEMEAELDAAEEKDAAAHAGDGAEGKADAELEEDIAVGAHKDEGKTSVVCVCGGVLQVRLHISLCHRG